MQANRQHPFDAFVMFVMFRNGMFVHPFVHPFVIRLVRFVVIITVFSTRHEQLLNYSHMYIASTIEFQNSRPCARYATMFLSLRVIAWNLSLSELDV